MKETLYIYSFMSAIALILLPTLYFCFQGLLLYPERFPSRTANILRLIMLAVIAAIALALLLFIFRGGLMLAVIAIFLSLI